MRWYWKVANFWHQAIFMYKWLSYHEFWFFHSYLFDFCTPFYIYSMFEALLQIFQFSFVRFYALLPQQGGSKNDIDLFFTTSPCQKLINLKTFCKKIEGENGKHFFSFIWLVLCMRLSTHTINIFVKTWQSQTISKKK